jgi:dihydrofolate reductase
VLTDVPGKTFEGAEAVYSIPELVERFKIKDERSRQEESEEVFVIGGGMVYRQMMPLADKLYITHIHHSWEDADTFFPEIKENEWTLESAEKHYADEKNPFDFTFAVYTRKLLKDKQ